MSHSGPDRVLAVRHGETRWNREGRVQGWAPASLNERGRREARALGAHLAERYDVDYVVASDLRRTRETAALLAEAGLPAATFERGWRERNFGVYQGFQAGLLFERHPEFDAKSDVVALEARPEGGESLVDLHERVVDAWADLVTADAETALLVTHGGPLHVIHGHVAGEDLLTAFTDHSHDNCGLTEFRLGDTVDVVCKNAREWSLARTD